MKVCGELEKAQLENLSSDPTGDDLYEGRVWNNTSEKAVKVRQDSNIVGIVPTGIVMDFAGSSAPDGWLVCDGSTLDSVANTEYASLYAVIGTTYGGTGADDFKLPDAQGRMTIGVGSGAGLTARSLGDSSGAETDSVPEHNHKWYNGKSDSSNDASFNSSGSNLDFNPYDTGFGGSGTGAVGLESGSDKPFGDGVDAYTDNESAQSVDTMSPFLALNKIIKY